MKELTIPLENGVFCRVEEYETVVSMEEFYKNGVDVDYFLGFCKECPNYGKVWSCPEYDFDVIAYWKQYSWLKIIGKKIVIPEELREQTHTREEIIALGEKILFPVKKQFTEELFALEEQVPGSVSLGAGRCMLCAEGSCGRLKGEPCRFPDKLRYSIESLGGNVTKAAEYLGQTIEWGKEDRLPGHYLLVGGLLYNRRTIDELLQTPYWIADILPEQVQKDSPGRYFAVEKYFLSEQSIKEIKQKHINVILKLNCYRNLSLDDEPVLNPAPERIAEEMRKKHLCIRVEDALIVSEPDETYLTLFDPDEKLLELIRTLSAGEGLFVWQPNAGEIKQ